MCELESTINQEEEDAPKYRNNKRKAPIRPQEPSDSDDEFEKMDVSKPRPSRRGAAAAKSQLEEDEEEEEEDERSETPQPLEEETESQSEEEMMKSPPKEEAEPQKLNRPNLTKAADPPPPPRRDLPFLRRDKGADTSKKAVEKVPERDEVDEATGGETDDDEL